MPISPFHAVYKARALASLSFGKDKLVPVFASSDIEIYPYQIAAAQFALRSPYLKGAILCDEGSLGKTFEAMLVIAGSYYEGKENIIVIIPTPLLYQWTETISNHFSLPYFTVDSEETFQSCIAAGQANPFMQDGVILTTYDFAAEKAEYISKIHWNLSVFEEAHRLRKIYTGENRESVILHAAVGDSFKLLLTATPMQNDIMDLYGLIYFIDETVFPEAKAFYDRYFRKPENYTELSTRVSKYCFRTTRTQVKNYVKIPERIPVTVTFTPSPKERQLYDLIDTYLKKPQKLAYPKMEQYDLALMLFRTLSSSTFALAITLQTAVKRVESQYGKCDELNELNKILSFCNGITMNTKGKELISALKVGFAELKKNGAAQKALIFTENKTTQKYLTELLKSKYKVLTYSGDKSRDYSIMNRFKTEAQILITTDIAAEGFNLEFCSFVINYDLPYNILTLEQRINRCHRQGQQNDVFVLNFFNQNNFADVRMLELINKRVLQFDGIIGLSDNVIGNFNIDYMNAFAMARNKQEIDHAFNSVLNEFKEENKQLVEQAEQSLFTSFSKDVADLVTITPQYIKDKTKEINDDLWFVTKYFFENRIGFQLDDETRTISCFGVPPKVFTGAKMGRNEYSMSPEYQPRSGRHTITGSLAKNILHEIFWQGIPDKGSIIVNGVPDKCEIAFYEVTVKPKSVLWGGYKYYEFVGTTQDENPLSDVECRRIMDLPVEYVTRNGERYGECDGTSKPKPHEVFDDWIDTQKYIQKTMTETDTAQKEEIERLKTETIHKKALLEHELDDLRLQVQESETELETVTTRLEKITVQKKLTTVQHNLKQAEQNQFMDSLRLEQQAEERINELTDKSHYSVKVKREFIIWVEGV